MSLYSAFIVRCFSTLSVFCTCAVAFAAIGASSPDAGKRQFDLPADGAELSLKRFSTQSGLQVLFAPELTDGIRANAVKGSYTPIEAAERLLAGTPLRLTRDEKTGIFSVARSAGVQSPPKKKA